MMTVRRFRLFSPEGVRARALATLALAVLAIALLASQSFAQEIEEPRSFDLAGHVYDQEGRPLVGAFVGLAGSDWGSLTNEDGRFRIPDVYEGTVELQVEQLGYETLSWRGDAREGDLVELRMEARPIVLEGLHVMTDRFQSRRNATATSVRAYDRGDLATSPQVSALDFLGARAGVTSFSCNGRWTNRCIRVRGRTAEPVVWVDEVPMLGGMEYLASLRPHELYMIEVYGNGRHIRAYTPMFMERAAKQRLMPVPFTY